MAFTELLTFSCMFFTDVENLQSRLSKITERQAGQQNEMAQLTAETYSLLQSYKDIVWYLRVYLSNEIFLTIVNFGQIESLSQTLAEMDASVSSLEAKHAPKLKWCNVSSTHNYLYPLEKQLGNHLSVQTTFPTRFLNGCSLWAAWLCQQTSPQHLLLSCKMSCTPQQPVCGIVHWKIKWHL